MANIITGVRIVCAAALIFCPTFSIWFYVLYTVCGISDVLDGTIARHLKKETKLGARLDTIADFVFVSVVIIKVVRAISIPTCLVVWIICIAVVKCINIFIGFVLYGRFLSEHTVMNKICGVLLFAIPLCVGIFLRKPILILMILTCGVATVAAVQEGYYICRGKEIE